MVEVECICCGAELLNLRSFPRPVMSSMCEACLREVELVQRAGKTIEQRSQVGVIH